MGVRAFVFAGFVLAAAAACSGPQAASETPGAGERSMAEVAPSAPTQPAAPRPELDFKVEPGKDFGDDTAFARSVRARFPDAQVQAVLVADLKAQAFECSALTAVPESADMALMDCVRSDRAGGACFDVFALTLNKAPGEGMVVVDDPRYARRCLGALPSK